MKLTGDGLVAIVLALLWLVVGIAIYFVPATTADDLVSLRDVIWIVIHVVWYFSTILGLIMFVLIGGDYALSERDEIAEWINKKMGWTDE